MVQRMALTSVWVVILANWLMAQGASLDDLVDAGHYRRARSLAEQRLKADPNDASALSAMSAVKQAAGDFDAALKLAEKAVALDPKNARHQFNLAAACGRKASKAGILSQLGLARRFKKEAETVMKLDPGHVDARFALIEFHLQAPGVAGGSKEKIQPLVAEISRINPSRGYLAQAIIARREKQTEKLEGLYRKAVEANPRSYEAHLALAAFHASDARKNYDLAEKHGLEARKLDPGRIGAYSLLAQAYVLQERWKELESILEQAEKQVPDNLVPYYQAGRLILQGGGDPARAEACFRKFLSQEPELGTVSHAHAHWRLGLTLEKQNRKAEAVASISTAVKLRPDLEEAKKDLKRLR